MDKSKIAVGDVVDDLDGLPGLGAVRRAALAVAGITTRAALARATADQFISITGIQRTYAIKILSIVQASASPELIEVPPLTDEAMPARGSFGSEVAVTDTSAPEPEPPFGLDLAIFRATTALADASRRYREPADLLREFVRFAKLLDRLPIMSLPMSKKRKSRIAALLDRATIRLEKAANAGGKLSKPKAEKLREALGSTQDSVKDMIAVKDRSNPKGKK